MVKGGKEKLEDSTQTKTEIIEKGIHKRNVIGKKLGSVGVEAHSSAAALGSNDDFAGYIFLCNGRTKPECFSYRVFGLPSLRIDIVSKIKPDTKLFLFDFDVKLLYGVYSATSTGTMNLEPHAFGGRFPAQVRFEIFKECMPMPESKFKPVIKDNYQGGSKFRQNLSADQVDNLISLFRPLPPPPSESPTSLLSKEALSRKILQQEIEKQSRSPDISTTSQQAPGSQYIASRFAHASYKAQPLSLPLYDSERPLSSTDWAHKEALARKILQQEIEKQSRSPDVSTMSQRAPESQYIASRFARASYKAQPLSHPLYDSERPLSLTDWAHERTSLPSLLYPLSELSPHDNLFYPDHPRHSYLADYSSSNPQLHGLSSGYMNGSILSRIDVNHRVGLPNDYHIYQNQNIGQGYIPQQNPQNISAPPLNSDRAPSSVLAAAYWVAVANEIPQPGVYQTSDYGHNVTEKESSSTSVQYQPPNLTSQSILDAYWEAKNLEDSRQAHPGTSHMLPHSNQPPISATTTQESIFPTSHAYYGDQSHSQHPNQLPVLISSQGGTGGAFPTSHTGTENRNGNEVQMFTSGLQQQVVYDPAGTQTQHGIIPYYPTYTL